MRHRHLLLAIGSLATILAGGELFARYELGLGSPPLSVADPDIEYMFAPDQDVMRFGNRQVFNAYGMRSDDYDPESDVRKTIVLGDSVLNGGSLTDQAELATVIASDADHVFGNVSAGSWGPANMTAWFDRYGPLGADTAIVVLSSHDLNDLPTFAALDPDTHPTRRPASALIEGIQRYLPRYLPSFATPRKRTSDAASGSDVPGGREAVETLFDTLGRAGLKVCLIQHLTRTEIETGVDPKHDIIGQIADDFDIPRVAFAQALRPVIARGENPFRDDIHINAIG